MEQPSPTVSSLSTDPADQTAPSVNFAIRLATFVDAPELRRLIPLSVWGLQQADYSPEQLSAAVETAFTLDTQLITDGTYFVVEASDASEARRIVACGGWSRRKTLCGGDLHAVRDNSFLNPKTEAAKIRAFFVHPEWARRGFGSRLLAHCEQQAQAAGFTRFEMGATLTGVPLYQARGYRVVEYTSVPLRDGLTLPVVIMARSL